jgi:hypothetical protein
MELEILAGVVEGFAEKAAFENQTAFVTPLAG